MYKVGIWKSVDGMGSFLSDVLGKSRQVISGVSVEKLYYGENKR